MLGSVTHSSGSKNAIASCLTMIANGWQRGEFTVVKDRKFRAGMVLPAAAT
jgi:hypothetical protein